MQSLGVEKPPLIRISSRSGRVEVHAVAEDAVTLESAGRIDVSPEGEVTVVPASASSRVSVRCPEGSSLIVGTASGAVDLSGKLGDVRVTTGSGAVTLGEAARADLRLASAPVQVGKCEGLRIHSASGDVRIGSGGDVEIALLSGKIEVGDVRKVRVRAASAPVSLGVRGDTEVETISGRVRVAVARGLRPLVRSRSLSGRRRNTCPEGNDLQVLIRTISGDIEVVPA